MTAPWRIRALSKNYKIYPTLFLTFLFAPLFGNETGVTLKKSTPLNMNIVQVKEITIYRYTREREQKKEKNLIKFISLNVHVYMYVNRQWVWVGMCVILMKVWLLIDFQNLPAFGKFFILLNAFYFTTLLFIYNVFCYFLNTLQNHFMFSIQTYY